MQSIQSQIKVVSIYLPDKFVFALLTQQRLNEKIVLFFPYTVLKKEDLSSILSRPDPQTSEEK